MTYDIGGGSRPANGPNLFHSFGSFSVGAGDIANFKNESTFSTANIIGRVTGPDVSNIFGTIRTTEFTSANLFLINPAGWVFGPTAVLEVNGSFHASTAHYLRLADGSFFYADGRDTVLTAAPPAAFGFLGPTGSITVSGSFLSVPEGQTLSLVGGNVQITADADTGATAALSAPGGQIQIGSFASAGEAAVAGLTGNFASLGRVDISAGTFIDTSGILGFDTDGNPVGGAGGAILIRGGQLFIDGSTITSDTFGNVDGASINFLLDESIRLTNGTFIATTAAAELAGRGGDIHMTAPQINIGASFVFTFSFGVGNAGGLSLNTGALAMTGGAGLASLIFGTGRGGDVVVNATESITISGRDAGGTPTSLFTLTEGGGLEGEGDGGTVRLTGRSLTITDGGTVGSTTLAAKGGDIVVAVDGLTITAGGTMTSHESGTGTGGRVLVTVRDSAAISGSGTDGKASGISTDSCFACSGVPGDITVQAGTLLVTQGGLIQSGSATDPQGGNVTVTATGAVTVSERGGITAQANTQPLGDVAVTAPSMVVDNGFVSASTFGVAAAGDVNINVQELKLLRGGQIASSSEIGALGPGGTVTVNANSIAISGASPSGTPSTPRNLNPRSGIFSTARGPGDAGEIRISTPSLSMSDGGVISVATRAAGKAGAIVANIGTLNLTGGARIDSSTTAGGAGGAITLNGTGPLSITGTGSGLFSTASSTGNAGQITVSAPNLMVSDGGKISVVSTGAGDAGSVIVTGTNVLVTTGGQIDSSSSGAGDGGSISIGALRVEIRDGGSVKADSTGAGLTGNITIAASDRIIMNEGSISTRAATSDGGNITLTAPNVIRLLDSQITTSVESGAGGGGNVFIDPQFVIMDGSSITANAFGGPGGNITIVANNFVTDPTSFLSASSALSTPGTVRIESPDNNLASDIAQLPRELVDASRLLRGGCTARRTSAPSSFVVAGRGGVPADPDGYLPSFSASGAPYTGARGAAVNPGFALAMAGWDCWQ